MTRLARSLAALALLTLPLGAHAQFGAPKAPAKVTLTASPTYKLQAVAEMSAAFTTLKNTAAAAAAGKATAAQKAAFHEGVVLLMASELARKAGDLSSAKILAKHAATVAATTGVTRIDGLKLDGTLGPKVKQAQLKIPAAGTLTASAGTWLLQGWEPDPL